MMALMTSFKTCFRLMNEAIGPLKKPAHFQSIRMMRGRPSHSKWSAPHSGCSLHTSIAFKGLEEFFPQTEDIMEEGERAGRSWQASDLRQKSYEDLHKLWYVLLKERNMLLTLESEANRCRYETPAPERRHKVAKSMARLKYVLHERALAIKEAKRELGLISEEQEDKVYKRKKAVSRRQPKAKSKANKRESNSVVSAVSN